MPIETWQTMHSHSFTRKDSRSLHRRTSCREPRAPQVYGLVDGRVPRILRYFCREANKIKKKDRVILVPDHPQ